ncbi:hypothetical protein LCGC14_0143140 [marine sediment metagenome]|uniref:Uncharacterized protein n=1 Tax=marine sediment metagenome TaxID=412755 RepID=A0A0F9VGU8_9ZZZZ
MGSELEKAKPGDTVVIDEPGSFIHGNTYIIVDPPNGRDAGLTWCVNPDNVNDWPGWIDEDSYRIIKRGGKQLISACGNVDQLLQDRQRAHFRKVLGLDDWEKEEEEVNSGPKLCRWCKGTKQIAMIIPGSTKPCLECVAKPQVSQHGKPKHHTAESGINNAWYSQEQDKIAGTSIYRLVESGKEVRVNNVSRYVTDEFNRKDSVFVGVVDKYIRKGEPL